MIEAFITQLVHAWTLIPFSFATWFVIFVLGFFVWLFAKANQNPTSIVSWEHLIVDSVNDRASPYKLGYLVGVIVSTWIVITFADGGKLSFDILGTYLTFLLGGAGVNSYFKSGTTQQTPTEPVKTADAGIAAKPPADDTSVG